MARCSTCRTRLPLARAWWHARTTLRGLMLRTTTGVNRPGCEHRWRIEHALHHRLSDARVLLTILLLLIPLVVWQIRIVATFSRVRPVRPGESVDYPLSAR
jgi:hypothetical protein